MDSPQALVMLAGAAGASLQAHPHMPRLRAKISVSSSPGTTGTQQPVAVGSESKVPAAVPLEVQPGRPVLPHASLIQGSSAQLAQV